MSTGVVSALMELPGVAEAVATARAACDDLRWHPGLRRGAAPAAAESAVRAARASAALEGAALPLDLVRDAARGARELPRDAVGRTVLGAIRACSAATGAGATWRTAPGQVLAAVHLAAAAGLVPASELGRPRVSGEEVRDLPAGAAVPPAGAEVSQRLSALRDLLTGSRGAPALVVAAIAHGELLAVRPFTGGNAVVARALARQILIDGGLDPTGVAVAEVAHLARSGEYAGAAMAYAAGSSDGVAAWIRHCALAVVEGAAEGRAVADAVLAGRLA